MPRIPRGTLTGHSYHVLNRGNGKAPVFHKDRDYQAFLELLATAKQKFTIQIFGFCLMPNHFHVVVHPKTTTAMSQCMQWWLTSHVRRYHQHYQTTGHVWQGRYKSFPIQQDSHFLVVLRYVLRNPIRAGLATTIRDWRWTSHHWPDLLDPLPVKVPVNWENWVEEPLTTQELDAVRTCVNRQAPYGSTQWQNRTAKLSGLQSTLMPRGRPRKDHKK